MNWDASNYADYEPSCQHCGKLYLGTCKGSKKADVEWRCGYPLWRRKDGVRADLVGGK